MKLESTFLSTAGMNIELNFSSEGLDDLLTRGNNPVLIESASSLDIVYLMPQNRNFTSSFGMGVGSGSDTGDFLSLTFEPYYQLTKNINIGIILEYVKSDTALIWIEDNQKGEY